MELQKDPKTHLDKALVVSTSILLVIAFSWVAIKIIQEKSMSANIPVTGRVLIVLRNSGSTNSPGFTLTVNKDGSGTLIYDRGYADTRPQFNRPDKAFPSQTFQVTSVYQILSQIGTLKNIPHHYCTKSISFGSVTTLAYNGQTSGDVSCIDSTDTQTYQNLRKEVDTFISQAVQQSAPPS